MSVKRYIPAGVTRAPNRRYESALIWYYLEHGRSTTWITNRTFIPLAIIMMVAGLRARGKAAAPRIPPDVLVRMIADPYRRGSVDVGVDRRADAVCRRAS